MTVMRHLLINPDGETIDAVLLMTEEDAALNASEPGVALYTMNPAADNGAYIDNGAVKFNGTTLVNVGDESPASEFSEFEFSESVPP